VKSESKIGYSFYVLAFSRSVLVDFQVKRLLSRKSLAKEPQVASHIRIMSLYLFKPIGFLCG